MLLWDTFFAAGKGQLEKGVFSKAEELLKSALAEAETFEKGDPRLLQTLIVLAEVYQKSGRSGAAEPVLQRAESLVADCPGLEASAKAAVLEAQLSQLETRKAPASEQVQICKDLVAVWAEAGPERRQDLADALTALARIQEQAELHADARTSLREAAELCEELHGHHSLELAEVLNLLAQSLFRDQSSEEAERLARRVLGIKERTHGAEARELAEPLSFLAQILERQKRYDEALDLIGKAASLPGEGRARFSLEYVRAQLRANRPRQALDKLTAMGRNSVPHDLQGEYEVALLRAHRGVGNVGSLCEQAERMAEAEELPNAVRVEALVELMEMGVESHDPRLNNHFDQALEMARDSIHHDGALLTRLGELAGRMERQEVANEYFDRAISARSDAVDLTDPGCVKVLYELGRIQERRRLLPDAAGSWERSLESLKRHTGQIDTPAKERILRTRLVQNLAGIYMRQRRWERAEQAWRSLVRSSQYGSKEHTRGRLGLAEVYTEQKNYRRALDYMDGEDRIVVDERDNGRRLYDKAFLLRVQNLAELGRLEQAKEIVDQRFGMRGEVQDTSVRELAAAVLFAKAADDPGLFLQICEELEVRKPTRAEEQLLLARFYEMLAHHNSKLLGRGPLPLELTPLQALTRAVDWALKANGQLDLTVAELMERKAQAAVTEGEWGDAEEATRGTLELRRILQGERSPTLLSSLQRLGDLQLGRGHIEEAVDSLEQAISLADAHLKPDDSQVRELLRSLVEAHRRGGDFEQAKRYLDRLLGLYNRFSLRPKDKLDDLMRGIRLLLDQSEKYRFELSNYLDEATELATGQGEIASLSLAFCLGHKARLVLDLEPDEALALLKRQRHTLKDREEATEFLSDSVLAAELMLFRGQPRRVLKLLSELSAQQPSRLKRELGRTFATLEAQALLQLSKYAEVGRRLEKLDDLVNQPDQSAFFKAQVYALQLNLYCSEPDLVGDEIAAVAYGELDRLVEQGEWSDLDSRHELRERWSWELARLRFETNRLSSKAALTRLTEHAARVESSSQTTPEALADALAMLGFHEEAQGLDEQATTHLRQAQGLSERCGDGKSLARAQIVATLARLYERARRLELAGEAYEESIAELTNHLGSRESQLVPLYLGQARVFRQDLEFELAETSLRNALAIVDEEPRALTLETMSQVLVDLAELLRDQERFQESVDLWNRVRSLWEQRDDLLPTIWLESYLEVHTQADLDAEALQFYLDGLPFRLGKGYDSVLVRLYAQWLERQLQSYYPSQAKERAQQLGDVREIMAEVVGTGSDGVESLLWARVLVALSRLHLQEVYVGAGELEADLEQALSLREKHDSPDSAGVAEVLKLRAALKTAEDDLDAAEVDLTRALNIVESTTGQDTWEVAEILLQLATVYFRKQKFSPTEAVLQRTLELCRALLDGEDIRWIEVCHLQGRLALELGRPVEAYDSLMRALELSRTHGRNHDTELLVAAGRACLVTQRDESALKLFLRAERTFPEDSQQWDLEMEEVVLMVGELCLLQERFQEAEDRLLKVLELQEPRFGFGDVRLARVYRGLGLAAAGTGEIDTAEERLEIAIALQEEDLFQPLDLFTPILQVVEIHTAAGREERAAEVLEENLDRSRELNRPAKVAVFCRELAENYQRRGDMEKAEQAWRESLLNLEEANRAAAPEERDPIRRDLIVPLKALAALLTTDRRYTEAEELTKRRLKLLETTETDDLEVAEVLFDLGELYRLQELYSDAGDLHQRVLATKAAELGRTHPEVARSVRALGQIALGQGRLEEANSYLERALSGQKAALGEEDPELAETLFSLGDTAMEKGDFKTSEERYRLALEILEERFGENDIRTAKAWTALARLFERRQLWSKASPLLGRAVESVEAVLGPSHLEVADLLENTAKVYLASGQWEDVLEPLARSLAIRSDRLGETHPAVAQTLKLQGDHSLLLGDVVTARRLYGKADRIVSDYHGVESPHRFPFRFALASALRQLEEFEQADMHLRTLLKERVAPDSAEELRQADVLEELGLLELGRGNVSEAERFAKQSLEIRSRVHGPTSEPVAACMEAMARIHRSDGRTITAAALAERALDARESVEDSSEGRATADLGRAGILELLARLELDQANLSKASQFANRALNLRRDVAGEGHPDVAATLHLLGEIAVTDGRLEKAEGYFEKALERWENFFGGSHPQVFQAVTSLAQLYQKQGRLTLAEQYHQRNLAALDGRYGSDHPILAETLLGLGKLCRSQGNSSAAEQHLKRAAEIQTAVFGESDLKVANVLHTLALVYQDQRNYIAAEALLRKAQQIRLDASEAETSELAESNLALARLYRTSGKIEEAEPLLKKVLDWRSRRYGDEHPEVASILREMAELYADKQEYLKAQALVRRALDIYSEALGHRNLELIGPIRQLARLLEASGEVEEAAAQRRLARELMGAG